MGVLKKQRTRGLALVFLLVCALAAPAGAAGAKKKTSGTAKKTAASTTRSSAGKKGSAKKGKVTTSATRRRTPASPPRQNSPSPDRYREIQQALVERGYSDAIPDGTWGAQWVDALKRFQADQNLEVDGKLGALSIIALGLGPKRQALQMPPSQSDSGGQSSSGGQPVTIQQFLAEPIE